MARDDFTESLLPVIPRKDAIGRGGGEGTHKRVLSMEKLGVRVTLLF
jgi:hypothetical protein